MPVDRTKLYILQENGQVREAVDILDYSNWFEIANRSVARTRVEAGVIYTTFLGLGGVLFETAFLPDSGQGTRILGRYESLETAKKMHEEAVKSWVGSNT